MAQNFIGCDREHLIGGAVAAFAGDFCLRAFEGDDEG